MSKNTLLKSSFVISMFLAACSSSPNANQSTAKNDSTAMTQKNDSTVVNSSFNLDTTKLASGTTFYQCEMHAEVLSDKPGSCPECGMDLSPIVKH